MGHTNFKSEATFILLLPLLTVMSLWYRLSEYAGRRGEAHRIMVVLDRLNQWTLSFCD